MANDNNIPHFTALDIEKYHKGLLSSSAMNQLEKAALEDPFLADALEGYAVPGVNVGADIAELKKRLEAKTEQAKVIPLNPVADIKGNNFKMLRAAVIIGFVAGAAFLMYQFNNKSSNKNEIAQNNPTIETIKAADTTIPVTTFSTPVEEKVAAIPVTNLPATTPDKKIVPDDSKTKQSGGTVGPQQLTAEEKAAPAAPIIVRKEAKENADKLKEAEDEAVIIKKELAKQKAAIPPSVDFKKENNYPAKTSTPQLNKDADLSRSVATNNNSRGAEQAMRNQQTNIFRGRITDANNVGLPFANVTNPQDNVGTYTDAKGYFNLTSPDSVLNVQVRSLGFENNTSQLRNNVSSTQIVLQEDRSLSEVVINNQKPNTAARSREANVKIEESEPTDGWDNYDTYLSNNLKVPEEIKGKQIGNGSVQLSFEIDENGEPVNVRIEKSLCAKCDKEAIRLVKDGPKWKKAAAKKGRTVVTINF